jgi:hypothetical protein
MRIISHRGNLDGRNIYLENSTDYILRAIELGFDVEIDLWYENNKFYLGHDLPQYEIDIEWIISLKNNLWVHCKNITCMDKLYDTDINYFWHDKDLTTITSKGYFWSQPDILLKNGITVNVDYKEITEDIFGICSDYVIEFKKYYNKNRINNVKI